jgi:hypothetical protein
LKKNAELYPNDSLIREALGLELDCVEPPAVEKVWPAIEATLDRRMRNGFNVQSSWLRYAGIAAAACLLIFLGGFGLFRSFQLSAPRSELGADPESDTVAIDDQETPGVGAAAELETAMENTEDLDLARPKTEELFTAAAEEDIEAGEKQESGTEQDLIEGQEPTQDGRETVTVPVIWPDQLGESYLLAEEIILPAEEEERYKVAIYSGQEYDLLLVGSEMLEENIETFVEKIGEQFNFPIKKIASENGFIFFEAGGYTGLAFKQGQFYRAILAPSETAKKEQLKEIAALFQ